MQPNVIDLSHHNTVRDFTQVRSAGIWGVIHKATQGANFVDSQYAARRKAVTDAGMLWGAYHFLTSAPAAEQAKWFLAHAEVDDETLVAADFEANGASSPSLGTLHDWCDAVEQALGRKVVVYSGNLLKESLGGVKVAPWPQRRLWLAQYGPKWRLWPLQAWAEPWLWQYSEHGHLPGTDGNVDLNYYAGNEEQLQAEWAA